MKNFKIILIGSYFNNLFKFVPFYLLFTILMCLQPCALASEGYNDKKKKFILLTIDGGGVRGIIPARILEEIESRTNRPIYQLVDTIAGNSTGGIIALSLVKADETGRHPEYKAKDLVDLYLNDSKDIFARSLWTKLKTGFGFWGAKYDRKNLDNILQQRFKGSSLKDVLKPVLIFSYNLNSSEGHIWNSNISKLTPEKNFYLKDIAAATSAAPTYFDPVKLSNVEGKYCHRDNNGQVVEVCIEADGGIFSNNPEIIAAADVLKNNRSLKISDLVLVSIGTGIYKVKDTTRKWHNFSTLNWLIDLNIIDLILNSSTDLSQWVSEAIGIEVYRIQMTLPENLGKLDDASKENLVMLLTKAEDYIQKNETLINAICQLLLENAK